MIRIKYRMKKTGVPILYDSDIDTAAELLLRDYNPGLLINPQPLNVEDITENYLRLNIHYENLSHNGTIWGRMVFNDRQIPVYVPELGRAEYCPIDTNTVVIDNSLLDRPNEFALRSTMMHECGHSVYHAQIFRVDDSQLSIFQSEPPEERIAATLCRFTDILGNGGNQKRSLNTDHDWIEHHAKYFSAAMLMPKSMVELVCKEPGLRDWLTDEYHGFEEELLADHVSEVFNVSPTSARIRIKQLKLGFEYVPNKNPCIFNSEHLSRIFD